MVSRRWVSIADRMCRLSIPIVVRLAQVAAAGDWKFEAVYMESFLIGVGEQPHKVVLLQACGVVVLVYEGAGCSWVHALLQSLCLGVFHITSSITLRIILIGQIDNHFPLAICVGCSLGAAIEDIRRAKVAAILVIIRSILVTTVIQCGQLNHYY